MPQLDISTFPSQVFWLVVTFSTLLFIMWRIAVPKISNALEVRQKRMDDHLQRAEAVKKEAEAAIEAYEKSLADAHSEAQSLIADAGIKLAEEAQVRDAKLAETMHQRIAESETNIAAAIDAAMDNIRDMATEVAIAATERLGGEVPGGDDAGSAVTAAIKARG